MPVISRSIPGLFGGVSQQIPAMRHPTQGEVQENGLATVVEGLYKRPGTKLLSTAPMSWASTDPLVGNVGSHIVDRGDTLWAFLFSGVDILAYNMLDGSQTDVKCFNIAGGQVGVNSLPYIEAADPQSAFRCITVADTTFVVNTEKTVVTTGVDAFTVPDTVGYVYVRQAVPNQTYSVHLQGTTPISITSAATTTVPLVAAQLQAAIGAVSGLIADLLPEAPGLIRITASLPTSFHVSDSFGNSTMLSVGNGVPTYAQLPPAFWPNTRVRIVGTSGSSGTDPYWVEWRDSKWVEAIEPGAITGLNANFMPHTLTYVGGFWELRPATWAQRLVGDDKTNPLPSFVGRKMRDIFFYRNRLGFLAGDSLIMSRAGEYFNFFASTATDVLDGDPIDLGGGAESVETLDWAVPFNQSLVVWANENQQFMLAAGEVLSPSTARLVPTTAFESINTARPRQLGARILFPSLVGGYTQLGFYQAAQDRVSTEVIPITDHVPAFLPGTPRAIEISEAAKAVAVLQRESSELLYIFKYEAGEGGQLTQRAWQKFRFRYGRVVKAHWHGRKLYLVMVRPREGEVSYSVTIEMLDLSVDVNDWGTGMNLCLDMKRSSSITPVDGEAQFTVPGKYSSDAVVLFTEPGKGPIKLPVTGHAWFLDGGLPYTTFFVTHHKAGTVVVGEPYWFLYWFTEVFMRDKDGSPMMDSNLKLLKMIVRYEQTGTFRAVVRTHSGGQYLYPFTGLGVGMPGQVVQGPILWSGELSIPVHAQAAKTSIELQSDSYFPCRFPFATWRGSVTMKSKV
jgi:hypothetical protein